ncbi:MAG: tyrosine-type recombinase/integrase [Desulfoprunum sp.]|jgi:integrase|nr:integrase [Desulfobulbus sp. Tol-SR]
MSLTDTAIRNAKPKDQAYKLTDEKGLYLLVSQSGKYFRQDYRFGGKRKTLSHGVYPKLSLKEAREKRDEAHRLLQNDIDPGLHKKMVKMKLRKQTENSLQAIAMEWYAKFKHTWTEGHARTIISRLENNVFPWLGEKAIADIKPPELLAVLRRIEERGALETAHRVKQICGQVFRYAIATGRAERDPSNDLRGALPPTRPKSMATITELDKVGELLRAIDGYRGNLITRCALQLAPLVFVRPGELRHAEWKEIDLEKGEWKIPAAKMKMRTTHIVPLADQAVRILEEIKPLTGLGQYVFPSLRPGSRPMSENTVLAALRRLGFAKEEMSGHGFRAMASTILHEQGWQPDVIERQLAHAERNKVKAAYNHAQYLPERRKMMQTWADYLDNLKGGEQVRRDEDIS